MITTSKGEYGSHICYKNVNFIITLVNFIYSELMQLLI